MAKQEAERPIAWAQDYNTKGTQIKVCVISFMLKLVLWFGSRQRTRDDIIEGKKKSKWTKKNRGALIHTDKCGENRICFCPVHWHSTRIGGMGQQIKSLLLSQNIQQITHRNKDIDSPYDIHLYFL